MTEVGQLAIEQAGGAVGVLVELMSDQTQAGPVRVASAKAVIDYAVKLSAAGQADTLAKLDRLLEEMHSCYDGDPV